MSEDDSLTVIQSDHNVTADERRFVDAILQDPEFRITEGCKAVGGLDPAAAQRWLRRDRVRRYMSAALADRRERYKDIRDGVIQALWALATYDIKDAIDDSQTGQPPASLTEALGVLAGGRLRPPHELPASIRAAVVSVKHGQYGWEYKFVDRAKILLALAKHFGDLDKLASSRPENGEDGTIVERRRIIYYEPTSSDKSTED